MDIQLNLKTNIPHIQKMFVPGGLVVARGV